jgi:hypothetical protein
MDEVKRSNTVFLRVGQRGAALFPVSRGEPFGSSRWRSRLSARGHRTYPRARRLLGAPVGGGESCVRLRRAPLVQQPRGVGPMRHLRLRPPRAPLRRRGRTSVRVELCGALCKEPTFRTSRWAGKICDLLLRSTPVRPQRVTSPASPGARTRGRRRMAGRDAREPDGRIQSAARYTKLIDGESVERQPRGLRRRIVSRRGVKHRPSPRIGWHAGRRRTGLPQTLGGNHIAIFTFRASRATPGAGAFHIVTGSLTGTGNRGGRPRFSADYVPGGT